MQNHSLTDRYEREIARLLRPQRPDYSPDPLNTDQFARKRPLVGGGLVRNILLFCIAALIGVGGTLAWQSRSSEAREVIRIWLPGLGQWLSKSTSEQNTLPQSAFVRDAQEPAAMTASDLMQRLEPMARSLAGTQRSLEQLTDIARDLADTRRSVEQLAARQEQLAQGMAVLQAFEEDFKKKMASSRPATGRKQSQPAAQLSAGQQSPSAPSVPPSGQQPLPLR